MSDRPYPSAQGRDLCAEKRCGWRAFVRRVSFAAGLRLPALLPQHKGFLVQSGPGFLGGPNNCRTSEFGRNVEVGSSRSQQVPVPAGLAWGGPELLGIGVSELTSLEILPRSPRRSRSGDGLLCSSFGVSCCLLSSLMVTKDPPTG